MAAECVLAAMRYASVEPSSDTDAEEADYTRAMAGAEIITDGLVAVTRILDALRG